MPFDVSDKIDNFTLIMLTISVSI